MCATSLGSRCASWSSASRGCNIRTRPPQVFICAFRPLPRRVFTAAHEVGHHVFGHGAQIDEISHANEPGSYIDPDEFLVDVFAGLLLMPPLGVRRAFRIRGLSPAGSDPTDFYRVACSFGVGYSTLIDHMTLGLRMFGSDRREELLQWSPKRIRESVLGNAGSDSLVIVDDHWSLPTIDVEIGHHILMPAGTVLEGAPVADITDSAERVVVRAVRPGIARASAHDGQWSAFVRGVPVQLPGPSSVPAPR